MNKKNLCMNCDSTVTDIVHIGNQWLELCGPCAVDFKKKLLNLLYGEFGKKCS